MRSVLVTGAARGFGRALCEVFLHVGWRVFALVRRDEDVESLTSVHTERLTAFTANVCDQDAGQRIREVLDAAGGRLDVLVNNAGRSGSGMSIDTLKARELSSMFDLHCVGVMRCTRAALPYLRRSQRALLLNVSSRLGSLERNASGYFRAGQFSYDYRVAKAAQNMLTLCLSSELAGSGVIVCALHPGRLKTETGADDADTSPGEAAERLLDFVRAATPEVNGRFFDLFDGEIGW